MGAGRQGDWLSLQLDQIIAQEWLAPSPSADTLEAVSQFRPAEDGYVLVPDDKNAGAVWHIKRDEYMCCVMHQFTRDSQHWARDNRSANQILEEDWQAHTVHASAFGRPMVTLAEWDSENTAPSATTIAVALTLV